MVAGSRNRRHIHHSFFYFNIKTFLPKEKASQYFYCEAKNQGLSFKVQKDKES